MKPQRNLILITALVVAAGLAAFGAYSASHNRIDDAQIVQNSLLKEKTFAKMPQELQTPSGLKFWLIEEHTNPIISLSFAFKNAGRAYDPEGQKGISRVASHLLKYGAGEYDYEQLTEELELNAIQLDFESQLENFAGLLVTPSENQQKAFELLHLTLTKPRFDANFVKYGLMLASISWASQKEDPDVELSVDFNKHVYGNHPYGDNPRGIKDDFVKITPEKLNEYIRKSFARDKLIISIAGDMTPDEAIQAVEKVFAGLPEKNLNQPVPAPTMNLAAGHVSLPRDTAQVISMFGARGTPCSADDFYPLYLANFIFGSSGLTSRLSLKARENEGLTYGIYTGLVAKEKNPLIMGTFSTTKENYPKIMKIVQEEWHKMAENGVTAAELENARRYLLASYNLRFKTVSHLAEMLTSMQDNNLGIDFLQKRNDYIRNVTLDQVNRAAARYFANDPFEMNIGLVN